MAPDKQGAPLDSDARDSRVDEETPNVQSGDAMAASQDSADLSNRRASYRCPVQPDQQRARLIQGRSRYQVRLVDQSAGGYSVAYSGQAEFHVGQMLRLQTLAGFADVGVAYVAREEDTTRIGLVHIECVEVRSNLPAAIACFLIVGIASALLFHFVM